MCSCCRAHQLCDLSDKLLPSSYVLSDLILLHARIRDVYMAKWEPADAYTAKRWSISQRFVWRLKNWSLHFPVCLFMTTTAPLMGMQPCAQSCVTPSIFHRRDLPPSPASVEVCRAYLLLNYQSTNFCRFDHRDRRRGTHAR